MGSLERVTVDTSGTVAPLTELSEQPRPATFSERTQEILRGAGAVIYTGRGKTFSPQGDPVRVNYEDIHVLQHPSPTHQFAFFPTKEGLWLPGSFGSSAQTMALLILGYGELMRRTLGVDDIDGVFPHVSFIVDMWQHHFELTGQDIFDKELVPFDENSDWKTWDEWQRHGITYAAAQDRCNPAGSRFPAAFRAGDTHGRRDPIIDIAGWSLEGVITVGALGILVPSQAISQDTTFDGVLEQRAISTTSS